MIKILHVFHMMGNGGVEHYVMDRYRMLDRSRIQFDFLMTSEDPGFFDEEIKKMGGRIYHTVNFSRHPLMSFRQIAKIVRDNKYDIVHRHTGNAVAYADLWAAKFGGAKHLIIHSHSSSTKKRSVHALFKRFFALDCIRLACSQVAGEWLFGNKNFSVMKNAIDTEAFLYNDEKRQAGRVRYGIDQDAFVIGHIGRFFQEKNHDFLVDVFAGVAQKRPNAVLMCIGDGHLKPVIESKLENLNLRDKAVFTGSISNVAEVINCFDVFCFPSKYEGLGITLVEAQVNGLKCFTSDKRVPIGADLSGNVTFIPLEKGPAEWANMISNDSCRRDFSARDKVIAAGYDLRSSVKEMEKFYLDVLRV